MSLRTATIKLAHEQPKLRKHLVPLLRKEAMEFDSPEALKEYLHDHPDADKSKHHVKKHDDEEHGKEEGPSNLKGKLKSFLSQFKAAKKDITQALQKAPETVQRIVVDPEHRKKALGTIATGIRNSPRDISQKILHATKAEVHEIHHALKAGKKLLKKPTGPFTKEDKKALYAAGAYAVSASMALIPPGTILAAAGALGHSFATHIGIKAVHKLLDHGFTHFEWAESLFHGLHHIASKKRLAADEDTENDAADEFTEGLVRVIADIMAEGLSDEDMEQIMSGSEIPESEDDDEED